MAEVASTDNPEAWQALLGAELSPARARELGRLIETQGLSAADVMSHASLAPAEAQRVASLSESGLKDALDAGVRIVRPTDFPETLAQVSEPPPALFAWGQWDCAHEPKVAIVGTRGASTYGRAVASKFAEAFARAGVTVISGGALGIDAAAHKGAMSAGGKTIAVLAGGLDKVYPAVHGGLFTQIRGNGCLVSQFAIGTRPNAYKFLVRNGLIASMADATLIVEAPARSGALATANAANELGRPVFVVPANIDNLLFAGSHALIRDGATLVSHPEQVLSVLGLEPGLLLTPPPLTIDSEVSRRILEVLTTEPRSAEFITGRTGLDTSTVLSELTMLEMDGIVLRESKGYAIRP